MVVSIEGSVGCGKSTILTALHDRAYRVKLEPVEEWHDVLSHFYAEPKRYGLALQTTVLSSFIDGGKEVDVMERSALSCRYVFGALLSEDGSMDAEQYEVFKQLYAAVQSRLVKPHACIYIYLTPEACHERMTRRGREAEGDLSLAYLKRLHAKYMDFILEGRYNEERLPFGERLTGHSMFKHLFILDGTQTREALADQVELLVQEYNAVGTTTST